jgi:hypothetical protein
MIHSHFEVNYLFIRNFVLIFAALLIKIISIDSLLINYPLIEHSQIKGSINLPSDSFLRLIFQLNSTSIIYFLLFNYLSFFLLLKSLINFLTFTSLHAI